MFISTYTSGACAGSPGPMGIGCTFYENTGFEFDLIVDHKGDGTPLEAEYHALIRALERAQDFLATQVDSYATCERLVKQITGEWGVKDEKLLPLFLEVMELMEGFKDGFSITWVPHAENAWAETWSCTSGGDQCIPWLTKSAGRHMCTWLTAGKRIGGSRLHA